MFYPYRQQFISQMMHFFNRLGRFPNCAHEVALPRFHSFSEIKALKIQVSIAANKRKREQVDFFLLTSLKKSCFNFKNGNAHLKKNHRIACLGLGWRS